MSKPVKKSNQLLLMYVQKWRHSQLKNGSKNLGRNLTNMALKMATFLFHQKLIIIHSTKLNEIRDLKKVVLLKLNAREKNVHAGEKLEDFETHFRIKWC
jgi:hypothetical protein